MAKQNGKPGPWLIAAWPGMGNVAVISAGYLIRQLGMQEIGELPAGDYFDVEQVEVKKGVVGPPHIPRGVFFGWVNPHGGRDLVVFIGESQPAVHTYAYANSLLQRAGDMKIERVVTFASMASGLHPSQHPKVCGVATDEGMIAELHGAEVPLMEDGQIGGLNGVLLGAAAEKGVPGLCLLAEIPFFAAAVPNPKAARAALSVFGVLSGIDIRLEELGKQAEAMDKALIDALERMKKQNAEEEEEDQDEEEGGEPAGEPDVEAIASGPAPEPPAPEPKLDFATRNRIEKLFEEARKDQGKSLQLKQELDRLGMFSKYEDRFLDLFKRAG